jgi:hypothetical protein
MDVKPNHTIYINNLNEKIKKEGKELSIRMTNKVSKLKVKFNFQS